MIALSVNLFEGSSFSPRGFDSELFYIARTLIRAAEERSKPSDDRLPEFQDSNRVTLELRLFSDAPIYDDVEELKLGSSLTDLAYRFGPTNPLIQQILAGKSPQERAVELVTGTRLKDVAARQQLYAGGADALKASSDPMLALAALVDPTARAARKVFDDAAETERQSSADIARARFALEGPDFLFKLIERLQIDCGAVRCGTLRAAYSSAHVAGLQSAAAQWRPMTETIWQCGFSLSTMG